MASESHCQPSVRGFLKVSPPRSVPVSPCQQGLCYAQLPLLYVPATFQKQTRLAIWPQGVTSEKPQTEHSLFRKREKKKTLRGTSPHFE